MTVFITLTIAGADTGPFNLYSNVDGFVSAFETNVSKSSLLAGYASSVVPSATTIIRIMSVSELCTNFIDVTCAPPNCDCFTYDFTPTTTPASITWVNCDGSPGSQSGITSVFEIACVRAVPGITVVSGAGTSTPASSTPCDTWC